MKNGRGTYCIATLVVGAAALGYGIADLPLGQRSLPYLAWHLLVMVLMVAGWYFARRDGRGAWRSVMVAGVVARLLLVPLPSFSTHDVSRYLWDGAVVVDGQDPYRIAPDDPAVVSLRQHWPVATEHTAYETIYPPAAIATFAWCASFGPRAGPWVWKGVVTAASVLALVWMGLFLRRRELDGYLPLFAYSPLVLMEVGVGAHVDVFTMLAVTGALWAWQRRRYHTVGLWLGLGFLFKFVPVLLLPPFLMRAPSASRRSILASFFGIVLAGYSLALAAGLHPYGFLSEFLEHWRFGSPLGAWAADASSGHQRLVFGALGGAAYLAALWAGRRRGLGISLVWALGAPLLVSPIIFPWYILPLAPLLAFRPSMTLWLWALALPLTYEVIDLFDVSGMWAPDRWPLAVIAVMVGVGAVIEAMIVRSRIRSATSQMEFVDVTEN